jgi:hypothetical protein
MANMSKKTAVKIARLREMRAKGSSLRDVASELGVHPSTVEAWERTSCRAGAAADTATQQLLDDAATMRLETRRELDARRARWWTGVVAGPVPERDPAALVTSLRAGDVTVLMGRTRSLISQTFVVAGELDAGGGHISAERLLHLAKLARELEEDILAAVSFSPPPAAT